MTALTFHDLRHWTRADTYHVTVIWPDGEVQTVEQGIDREGAFDVAAERHADGCGLEIVRLRRSPLTGAPIGVSDCTAAFFGERGIDPKRNEVCARCHVSPCRCDAEFEDHCDRALAAE